MGIMTKKPLLTGAAFSAGPATTARRCPSAGRFEGGDDIYPRHRMILRSKRFRLSVINWRWRLTALDGMFYAGSDLSAIPIVPGLRRCAWGPNSSFTQGECYGNFRTDYDPDCFV